MKVTFQELQTQLKSVLLKYGFEEERAELCARIFAENSRDGVYSHGLNRFPVFVQLVKEGVIAIHATPASIGRHGLIEHWDGHNAPGMYTATLAMQRAIALAKESGMGCVTVKNTNHWMRGGTYGWQAADAGCIGICATNSIANMPPYGGVTPVLGNNPLVIAVPHKEGHLVLDMAMSQFSYGKLQEYELKGEMLPVAGGYDENGDLTKDPAKVRATGRALPVGFWKGAGLSLMLDVLVSSLSGGRSVAEITAAGTEAGVSQFFLCLNAGALDESVTGDIITYTKSSVALEEGAQVLYPGERTLSTRRRNEAEGIPVNEAIWQQVLAL